MYIFMMNMILVIIFGNILMFFMLFLIQLLADLPIVFWPKEPMIGSNGFFATASEDTSLRIVKVEGAQQKDDPMVGFSKNIYIYTY